MPFSIEKDSAPLDADYERLFLDAFSHVKIELRRATPEWAREELEKNNKGNRHLTTSWMRLRAAIERGAWQVNGEAVMFDRSGKLINGQHRLKAVAESGIAVPVFVFYGINPDAFSTYDQGRRRSPGDVLSIIGHVNCNSLAAALAWQKKYEAGEMELAGSTGIPNDQAIKIAEDYPEMAECVAAAVGPYRNKVIPPSLTAFLLYQFSARDTELAKQFFERVALGINVPRESHEFLLRRQLEDKPMGRRHDLMARSICALSFITFNRMRRGEPVPRFIKWDPSVQRFPELDN